MNRFVFIQILCAFVLAIHAFPQQPKSKRPIPVFKQNQLGGLQLPDNATLIRDNIVDTFSCKERIYGYYADMENDCQIFHVCLPQTRNVAKWSFICPSETVFNQVFIFTLFLSSYFFVIIFFFPFLFFFVFVILSLYKATFVCTRTEESIPCEESEKYYSLNEEIGKEEENTEEETTRSLPVNADVEPVTNKPFSRTSRILSRQGSSQRY
ncbi:uncharacterized protein LOC122632449 isoform X1 [Vespula pensylvanica]|uniref:uncharacterized protein LOC122632449 isoform X1 n=1 Tax=Vespula pensylvanica TaxID=30213 RepID=UPI001CBA0FD7|nr:uncharacterized protein LOC122632449 isoform X1 [Vespula pensylvanica]